MQNYMAQNLLNPQATMQVLHNNGVSMKPPQVAQVVVPTCEVTVTVKCPQTLPGERVALLGASEELGCWNLDRTTFLETNDQMFPTWTVKLQVPRNSITEYKYLII